MFSSKWRTYNRLLWLLFWLASHSYGSFNSYELKEVLYDVSISDVPSGIVDVKYDADNEKPTAATNEDDSAEDSREKVLVSSEYGQLFQCALPTIPEPKQEEGKSQNFTKGLVADIVAAAFYVKECIRRNTGWWTYEMCYGKQIQQFHIEGSKIVGDTISLGFYQEDMELPTFKPKADKQLYFEQRYTDGTMCDVTRKPRATTVRYYCEELLETNEAYIDSVEEPSSCEYTLHVKSGSLCKLDSFLPVGRPRTALDIECRPLLNDDAKAKYSKRLAKEELKKKLAKERMEYLVRRAESIQKQRYARKRLALISPKERRKARIIERNLKKQFEDDMRGASRLSSEVNGEKADVHFVYDDVNELEAQYTTPFDEDRGNLYWYFMDPFWDRRFFPMTIAHVNAKNKYFESMTSFFKQFRQRFNERVSYAEFIRNAETGVTTETQLSLFIGPLTSAFREEKIPGMGKDLVFTRDEKWMDKFWLYSELRKKYLENFEAEITEALKGGKKVNPEQVMSKVARQILYVRNMLKEKTPQSTYYYKEFTFTAAEKIYNEFRESYNRAVKRFDRGMIGMRPKDRNGRIITWKQVIALTDRLSEKDLSADAQKLLHVEKLTDKLSEEEMLAQSKLAATQQGVPAAKRETAAVEAKVTLEENGAMNRLFARAKRRNLGKLVEEYFRRLGMEDAKYGEHSRARIRNKFSEVKKQLQAFEDLLKAKIRDTGIAGGAEIKIQLISTDGNLLGSAFNDDKTAAILNAFLAEQNAVTEEEKHQDQLEKGYSFGAEEEELERRRKLREDDSELKSRILPILRELNGA